MIVLIGVFAVIALAIVSAIWRGYVLSILWAWFVVTTFGLPTLGIAQAIGVAMVVSFLTHQYSDNLTDSNKTATEKFAGAAGYSLLGPLLVLCLGWIVKQYI